MNVASSTTPQRFARNSRRNVAAHMLFIAPLVENPGLMEVR